MLTTYVKAQIALTSAVARARSLSPRDERGQVSAEYLGIIAVLVVLIAALTGAAGNIANAIEEGIINKIEELGS
jgi:hypothetical protein